MKKVLSQLHNAIIELEDNNLIKEATVLSNVFTKLADYKDPYQTKTRHEMTRLKRKGNKPWEGNDLSTYRKDYDIKIRRAPAYEYYQSLYITARDNYVNMLNKFSNPQYRSNPSDVKQLSYLKAEWEAAVQDFESWFMSALIRVKNKQTPTGIPKKEQPEVKQTAKPAFKPVVKQVVKQKPATPQVTKPKPVEQKATAPVTTNQTTRKPPLEIGEPEITRRAQEFLDMLKSRVSSENEKIWQAYAFLQFKVYDADKTTGKLVYRKWQDLVDEYTASQQKKPIITTTPSAPSAPSTTQSNPSTSPTPIKEV